MQKGFTIIVRCINNKQNETLTIQLINRYWTKRLPQSCMHWNQIHVSKRKRTNIIYRSYKKFDETMFYMLCLLPRSMSQEYLMKLMTHTGCEVPYFKKWSMSMLPLSKRQLRIITYHYMNGELRRVINVKRMLKRKFTKYNSNMNWDKYRKQRNIVTKLLKKSLQQYAQKMQRGC